MLKSKSPTALLQNLFWPKNLLDIHREIEELGIGQGGSSDFLAGARGIAKGKTRSEDEKYEANPTPAKTNCSVTMCIESISQLIFEHAAYAHWIVFGALLLAGLNVPISEDLMIILSALLAATVVPENTGKLFLAIFLGCYLSDWVSYWIGRSLGRKLWEIRWFANAVKRERLDQISEYYSKYGFWTLLVGRFIPFGVRNCLFLTAGMGRMPFGKFLLSDGVACITSNTALFCVTYSLGKNYATLLDKLKIFNIVLFSAFVMLIIAWFWYKRAKKASSNDHSIK